MKHLLISASLAFGLGGCGLLQPQGTAQPTPITGPSGQQPATGAGKAGSTVLGARAVRAEVLDTTTSAEKAAALAAPAASGERTLGRVVVTLGAPAEQGLWLATPLVSAPVQGRVETASGQSLAVELRPGSGAAQLSLAAFQALGLSLTGLPEVTVFGP